MQVGRLITEMIQKWAPEVWPCQQGNDHPQVGIAVPILKTKPYEVTHGETSQTALTKCICSEI